MPTPNSHAAMAANTSSVNVPPWEAVSKKGRLPEAVAATGDIRLTPGNLTPENADRLLKAYDASLLAVQVGDSFGLPAESFAPEHSLRMLAELCTASISDLSTWVTVAFALDKRLDDIWVELHKAANKLPPSQVEHLAPIFALFMKGLK